MINRGKPSVSIIIPAYKEARNNFKTITKTIKSIKKQKYNKLELVINVDGTGDGTLKFSKKFTKKVVYSKNVEGIAKSLNRGLKKSKGDITIILHDDCELIGTDWVEKIIESFENPKVAAVIGNPHKKLEKNVGVLEKINLYFVGGYNTIEDKSIREVDIISEKCIAFRKKVLKKIGYFNERYIVAGEDIDMSARIKKNGYKILLNPKCKVKINLSPNQDTFKKMIQKRFLLAKPVARIMIDNPQLLFNKSWFMSTFTYMGYFIFILLSFWKWFFILPAVLFNLLITMRIIKKTDWSTFIPSFILIPIFTLVWMIGIIYGVFLINKKRI